MNTRVRHEYNNKQGVILGHPFFIVILGHPFFIVILEPSFFYCHPRIPPLFSVILGHPFFIVILGLVPRIHLKTLDTRVKHEYDKIKELEYNNKLEVIPRL